MKKIFSIMMITLALLLVCPISAANAVAKIDLAFDGVIVPDYQTLNSSYYMDVNCKGGVSGYYLEARPEMKDGVVFVPVRVVSEIMGAKVSWLGEMPDIGQSVVIEYQGHIMQLFTSSILGHKPTGAWEFTQIPYEKNGSIYVPVRFVAEAFDCQVDWDSVHNLVNIQPPARQLDGQPLTTVVRHVMATMEHWDIQLDSAFFADKLYRVLCEGLADEVPTPQNTGYFPNLDIPDFYYLLTSYDFVLADGSSAASCEVYIHVPGQPLPDGYTTSLVHIGDKWYNWPDSAAVMFTEWQELAHWQPTAD